MGMWEAVQARTYNVPDPPEASLQAPAPEQLSRRSTTWPGKICLISPIESMYPQKLRGVLGGSHSLTEC